MEEQLVWASGAASPALNMARDEALLEAIGAVGRVVLRLYAWDRPAASFGYFQNFSEVVRWTEIRPLVRRPTGGGVVPHLEDWTYSVVIPPGHPWHRLRAEESYRRLHRWIQNALERLDWPADLAAEARKQTPGCCFAGPERHDLIFDGKKIAGAAQRRNRLGMLIQGSIQPVPPGSRPDQWQTAMLEAAVELEGAVWAPFLPSAELEERARQLSAEKFEQDAYLRKR